MNLREVAFEVINRHYEAGYTLDNLTRTIVGTCSPADDEKPAVWTNLGAGYLFGQRDGGERIKLKYGQIGVAFYWKDGRCEHGIFDVKELWEEVTGVRAVQLSLWSE
jgi:hypothetical protein